MVTIEDGIERWLKKSRIAERLDGKAIFARWAEVVGEDLAASTRPVDIRGGELVVEVGSPALLNELSTYFREEILESLRQVEEFRKIHEIRFRAGSF